MNNDILLVDDETSIREVLSMALRGRGYVVRTAATGEDALAAIAEASPAVLLLDINLPDITGWEVLRRAALPDRMQMPVVVLSAAPISRSRIAEFEPTGVLVKPFPMDALLRLIEEAMNSGAKA